MINTKSVTVLLVEDDALDVKAVHRAFKKARIANPVVVAGDGIVALANLRGTDGFDKIETPLIILLDLNMPRMNGLEFLAALRADPALAHHVVFVLTTSNDDRDRTAAYADHIAGYITKSELGVGFMHLVDLLHCYWRIVELPT